LFADGKTLDEKIQNIQPSFDVDERVLEIDDGVLSIKNYGKQYYAFIPEQPAQGIEGQPGYVPVVAAHYELVTVDAQHPWEPGLSPRTDAEGNISWYEPNL